MKKPASPLTSFENIQAFLDDSRGQITIGEIPPIRSAALAAEGKKVRVALARRDVLRCNATADTRRCRSTCHHNRASRPTDGRASRTAGKPAGVRR
jgi:hypothetical protein